LRFVRLLTAQGDPWTKYSDGYQAMSDAVAQGTCPSPPADCPAGLALWRTPPVSSQRLWFFLRTCGSMWKQCLMTCLPLARREAPLEVARKLGAAVTINVTEVADVAAAVKAQTDEQRGPDCVVEAAGNPATWRQALAMVRRGGVVNFFSGLPADTRVEIAPATIHYSEIKIISPFHHTPRFIREAMEAIRRGDISAQDFVTEEISLGDLPQAFERMKARSGEIKLAVRP
jgi:D-arabinose 1-dehydrogenase-like Zn-dependent alcohol dehydrogenase